VNPGRADERKVDGFALVSMIARVRAAARAFRRMMLEAARLPLQLVVEK
jgi:hypothetical protein